MSFWEHFREEYRRAFERWLNSNSQQPLLIMGDVGVGKTELVHQAAAYFNYQIHEYNLTSVQNISDFKKKLRKSTAKANVMQMMFMEEWRGTIILLDEIDSFLQSDRGNFKDIVDSIRAYNQMDNPMKSLVVLTAHIKTRKDKKLASLYRLCHQMFMRPLTRDDLARAWGYHEHQRGITINKTAREHLVRWMSSEGLDLRELARVASDLAGRKLGKPDVNKYLEHVVMKEREHPYQDLLKFCFEDPGRSIEQTFQWASMEPNLLPYVFHEHLPLIYTARDLIKAGATRDWALWNQVQEEGYEDWAAELRHVVSTAHVTKLAPTKIRPQIMVKLEKFSESYQRRNLNIQRQNFVNNSVSPIDNWDIKRMSFEGLLEGDKINTGLIREFGERGLGVDDFKLLLRHTTWTDRTKGQWTRKMKTKGGS